MLDCTISCLADFQGRPIREAVQLARVSGYKQEQEETIKTQIAVMNRFFDQHGIKVVDRYADENVKNEVPLTDRKEGGRLWRQIQKGPQFQAIIVYTIDRWSRVPYVFWPEYWVARQAGVRLISATQQFDDRTDEGILNMQVLVAIGTYDKSQVVKKLVNGRRRVLSERCRVDDQEIGYWVGGVAPYGYHVVEHQRRYLLLPDTRILPGRTYCAADVIQWIFAWSVEEHLTSQQIAQRLNARGVPTYAQLPIERGLGRQSKEPTAGVWHHAYVTKILHTTTYMGVHHYGKRQDDGRHVATRGETRPMPPLVSESVWRAAQQVLRENTTWADRNRKRNYLLTGKIHCAYCGYTYYAHPQISHGKAVDHNWYYSCRGRMMRKEIVLERHGVPCRAPHLRGPDLEAEVIEACQWFIDHPTEAIARLRREMEAGTANVTRLQEEIDALRAERAALETQRNNARRLAIKGLISDEELERSLDEIRETEYQLAEQIDEREGVLGQAQGAEEYLHQAAEILQHLQAEDGPIASWDFARRRRLIEQWVREVVVTPPDAARGQDRWQVAIRLWVRKSQITATSPSHRFCHNYLSLTVPVICSLRRKLAPSGTT